MASDVESTPNTHLPAEYTSQMPRDMSERTNSDSAVGGDPFRDGVASEEDMGIDVHDDVAGGLASATLSVGRNATLTLATDSLIVLDEGFAVEKSRSCCGLLPAGSKTTRAIPFYNILWADLSGTEITIHHAAPVNKSLVRTTQIFYSIDKSSLHHARAWVNRLLTRAYGRAQQRKRIKVLINPFSGKGNAEKWYARDAAPILAAAQCKISVERTTHNGHAVEIGRELDTDAWDVVACCSGDGVPHEVFNGLGQQKHARAALAKVALAQLPCGSGNAMCVNLYGTASPSLAALALVKGVRTPMDLVSVTQGDRRTLSFLSQSIGIVAECDLGTDNLRWMGGQRFTVGFLMRVLGRPVYPIDIAVGLVDDSKDSIRESYRRQAETQPNEDETRGQGSTAAQVEEGSHEEGLPPLRYGTVTDELPTDWTMMPYDNMGMFYAGNMAWMASDGHFFNAALPNDGCLDVLNMDGDVPISTSITSMLAVGEGKLFDMPEVSYRKVSGYRIIPKQQGTGYISIDGESVPFEPFQAEVHKGLGTVLSRSGFLYEGSGVQ